MAGQYVSNDVKTSLGPVGLDRMLTNDILGDIDAATVLRMLRRWGVKEPATNVFDITRNPVTACQAASNDVKTSLGPVGLDPMLTNDILGDIDAATVLRMLRRWGVKEPATNVFDITRNPVTACQAASNDVKTSLGPVGLDPMLTNDILGDIDAATVLRMLRRWGVKEPATNVFDITRNPVTACQAASNDVKTSLGPVGLDPMLTNDILGDIDAATVLRMLRRWGVKEPATNVFDITRNPVTACQAASNDVKTSLGPVGLDPMLTNDILGDIDAATVLRMLRRWGVKEPATNVFDITRNPVTACQAASKNIKTSLGPVGLDRMLMDDIGEMTITTDAATILRMFRRWGVKHPATKNRPEEGCEEKCLSKLKTQES